MIHFVRWFCNALNIVVLLINQKVLISVSLKGGDKRVNTLFILEDLLISGHGLTLNCISAHPLTSDLSNKSQQVLCLLTALDSTCCDITD